MSAAPLLGGAAAFLRFDAPFLGPLGGAGLLADLGFLERRPDQRLQAPLRRAPIALLGALAHGLEQNGTVVDELLAGEAPQAISHRHRQADILRQQEAQLRGARHLVDVLPAGPRGANELPFQFLVRNDDVGRDDQGHGNERALQSRSECPGFDCTTISRCATGMVMLCCLNRRQMARFTSERTLFTPSCGSEIQKRSSSSMPLSLKCIRRETGAGSCSTRACPSQAVSRIPKASSGSSR